jgi:uncharacterized repeat protein (TIGR03803 family)
MKSRICLLMIICCLCRIARADLALQVLYTFPTNAAHYLIPGSYLAEASPDNFYGSIGLGGSNNCGAVFRVTPAGVLTNIFSFNGTNGYGPGSLVNGNDGNLYGITAYGGTTYTGSSQSLFSAGTVFKITTNGVLTSLVSFKGTNGFQPTASLTLGSDGNFYGATFDGGPSYTLGASGNGTIFKITTNGILTPLVFFNGTNGAAPLGGLTLGNDGLFYGTTFFGGTNYTGANNSGNGTVFKMDTNGVLTSLMTFSGANTPQPRGNLVLGSDQNFYGTTGVGGTNNTGTVFQVTTNGDLTTLVSFSDTNGPTRGYLPGPLTMGNDGNFYGTTAYGGNPGSPVKTYGTIFRVTTNGDLTTLAYLNGTNGSQPSSQMIVGDDGNLYCALGNVNGQAQYNSGTFSRLVLPPIVGVFTPTNNGATLSWTSFSNGVYRVESSPSLTPPNWTALATNTATGNTTSFTDTSGGATQNYYRVRLLP